MMIDCPVCGKKHTVNDRYDNKDFICPNTTNAPNQKIYQDVKPTDQLTRSGYNWNRSSTLEDTAIPTTIEIHGPDYRPTGEKIGQLKKNY